MEHRKIGGLNVSLAGLGCGAFGMTVDQEQANAIVGAALDEGVTFFDTADVYGFRFKLPDGSEIGTHAGASEEMLGRALGKRRSDVVIATKFGSPLDQSEPLSGGSAARITQAVEASLRRLGTDYIDLYQQHFPDATVPIEETLQALDDLVRVGKVREIGGSNYSAPLVTKARELSAANGWAPLASTQSRLSLLHREALADLVPACAQLGVGFIPYSPVANGLLTGKYRRGDANYEGTQALVAQMADDHTYGVLEKLNAFAMERGCTMVELACSWLAALPAVPSIIAGATRPVQVRSNAQACTWRLTEEDVKAIDVLIDG